MKMTEITCRVFNIVILLRIVVIPRLLFSKLAYIVVVVSDAVD